MPNLCIGIYLIPIKIRSPLIIAHLACAKIKGSKFPQCECAGEERMPRINEKNDKFAVK